MKKLKMMLVSLAALASLAIVAGGVSLATAGVASAGAGPGIQVDMAATATYDSLHTLVSESCKQSTTSTPYNAEEVKYYDLSAPFNAKLPANQATVPVWSVARSEICSISAG